jgi:hypothetical protein
VAAQGGGMLGDGSGYAGHYLPSAQYGAAYPPQPAPGVPVVDLDWRLTRTTTPRSRWPVRAGMRSW